MLSVFQFGSTESKKNLTFEQLKRNYPDSDKILDDEGEFDDWGCPSCGRPRRDNVEKITRKTDHYGPACHHERSLTLYECDCGQKYTH